MLSAHLHWGWKALDPRKDVGESLGCSAFGPGSALLQQRLARAAESVGICLVVGMGGGVGHCRYYPGVPDLTVIPFWEPEPASG